MREDTEPQAESSAMQCKTGEEERLEREMGVEREDEECERVMRK